MTKANGITRTPSGLPAVTKRARNDLASDVVKADVGLAACEAALQHGQIAQVLADSLLETPDGNLNDKMTERDEEAGGYTKNALELQAQFRGLSRFAADSFKRGVEFLHVAEDYMRRDENSAKTTNATVESPVDKQTREARERAERRKDSKRNRKQLRAGRAQNGVPLDEKIAPTEARPD